MQIAKSIYNRKYFIFTATRLEKIFFKNEKSRATAPSSNFNNYRPSLFNKLKEKISNYFIFFRRFVMASINNNRYIYNNISGRS
jgi:hypothetical protein